MSSTLIDRTKMTGVSPSPVKALDSESSMRRFESYYPCQYDPLAQLAEHLTFNQGVPSSNLGWITKKGVAQCAAPFVCCQSF